MKKILVIPGPNLNLLGQREPDIHGNLTLSEIDARLESRTRQKGFALTIVQSNQEGEIIEHIQKAASWADALVINPGAYTHYSYAIYDALRASGLPAVEVHLSNIHSREPFRRTSVVALPCIGQISGFGVQSRLLALDVIAELGEMEGHR